MGVLPYTDSTGMCRAKDPLPPFFRPWPLLKTLLFRHGPLQKTPFSKIYNSLFRFYRPGQIEKTLVKKTNKKNVSLLFVSPKSPVFPVSGRSESPPFSVRGSSISTPPPPLVRHIYTIFIFEYSPGVGTNFFFFAPYLRTLFIGKTVINRSKNMFLFFFF